MNQSCIQLHIDKKAIFHWLQKIQGCSLNEG